MQHRRHVDLQVFSARDVAILEAMSASSRRDVRLDTQNSPTEGSTGFELNPRTENKDAFVPFQA